MVEMKVAGMTCASCANSVRWAILREFPQAKIRVDLETGLVQVEGDIELQRAILSIKRAGYDIVSASA